MKALLLHHPYVRPRFEQDFLDRVSELPEFDVLPADLGALTEGRLASPSRVFELRDYDAVLVFVAFNAMRRAPAIDWQGFDGLRVFLEHDAIQNYSDLFNPELKGKWPPVFRHHRFDLFVTSGGVVRDRLANDGIQADWLPKAVEPSRFVDSEGSRAGLTTFGSAYLCRQISERAIRDASLSLERIDTTPYPELGPVLARYLACMAVSSDLLVPLRLRPFLAKVPARWVPMRPGLEPMAKFFEAASAGCCPVADAMADLGPLGFVDGKTAITFRSHSGLVERLRWWFHRPEQLRQLGRNASALARARHTWTHRAIELREILARRLQS